MEDDFNVDAAVDEISSGLGFAEEDSSGKGEVDLDVKMPEPVAEKEVADAPSPDASTAGSVLAEKPEIPQPSEDKAPLTWRKEAAAIWASLPSEAKNEVLKREQDMFKGLEQYRESANYANTFRQAISQFEPLLRANNMDPIKTAAGLFAAHHALATSAPDRKLELLRTLAADYNIDIAQAAIYEAPYVDPAVSDLQSRLNEVQSRLAAADAEKQEAKRSSIASEVTAFAADSKNPYFDTVADDIAQLLRTGAAATLQEAYDKAVWTNPVTRAKEIARQTAEATAKAAQTAQVRVNSVKQATAANVTTRGKTGSTAAPTGTLDDTLSSALSEIRSRA